MISYDKERQIFQIDTERTSYIMAVCDGFLGQVYYGSKIDGEDVRYLLRTSEPPFTPSENGRERVAFLDSFPMEYPFGGTGDFRESCLEIVNAQGQKNTELKYSAYEIYEGKRELAGLPATWGERSESLDIVLEDTVNSLRVVLTYSVFDGIDAIVKSVKIENNGSARVKIEKILSSCVSVDNKNFEILSLHGAWARENHMQRVPVSYGVYEVASKRGISSHQNHPFTALVTKGANQNYGEVYACHFVYSGNFCCNVQEDSFDKIRMVMGIHPDDFCWMLEAGDTFQAPEVVCVYSGCGLGRMTRTFHDLYRTHLIRGYWKDRERPVLINNWEATYFDFDTDKLLRIVKQAAECGIELFVLDDGWFGCRNSDDNSLGDWYANTQKLRGGLKYLSEQVKKAGMKFGLWFEPEMVSPDSALFRAHPDWAFATKGKEPSLARCQLVLDFSRKEVVDCVFEMIRAVIAENELDYIKWDMNRSLTDVGNAVLPAERRGELMHRYMLGVYDFQERITKAFPKLLIENCSSGGGRFDPGMLYYSPQIWCSDNTDAIDRLVIQEGTMMLYPLSCIGSHVSVCPNHITGRTAPFATRADVAQAGTFGYELDVTALTKEDRCEIPKQIAAHKKYNEVLRTGDYYRLASYSENGRYDAYMVVDKEKTKAFLTFVQVLFEPNKKSDLIYPKGLMPDASYQVSGKILTGRTLMNAGLLIERKAGDFQSVIIEINRVNR